MKKIGKVLRKSFETGKLEFKDVDLKLRIQIQMKNNHIVFAHIFDIDVNIW